LLLSVFEKRPSTIRSLGLHAQRTGRSSDYHAIRDSSKSSLATISIALAWLIVNVYRAAHSDSMHNYA